MKKCGISPQAGTLVPLAISRATSNLTAVREFYNAMLFSSTNHTSSTGGGDRGATTSSLGLRSTAAEP